MFLVAMVAISLAAPGLALAQAPGETAAPGAADTQAAPEAPAAQAASPAEMHAPAEMQALDIEAPAQQAAVSTSVRVDEKHAGFALGGSLLTTGLGVGAMIVGIGNDNGALGVAGFTAAVIGPSFGHFYAGEIGRGLTQTGVRVGAAAMTVGGLAWAVVGFFDCLSFSGEEAECSPMHLGAPLLIAGGVGLGAGSMIHSIQDSPKAVRRYNAKARQLMLTPAPIAGPDHSTGFGLHLGGQF